MLGIMSLAFQGAGNDELSKQKEDSLEERRKQIFSLYVEQMFQRKGPTSLVFPKEKIIGSLSWLAEKMRKHSQSVLLVEGLQPTWLPTRAERVAYGVVAVLSILVLCGLIVWLIAGLNVWQSAELIVWQSAGQGAVVSAGLSAVLIAGLSFGLIGGFTDRVKETNESPNQGIKLSLKNSLAVFLIALSIIGLISGLIFGISGMIGGLIIDRKSVV